MVIFLFIAIAYIKRVESNQSKLKDFVENKQELHDKLVDKFKRESSSGILSIDGDLSMRFENAKTQFSDGSWDLKPEFKSQLSVVIPKYLDVLLNDSLRYKIREIRIEGHTNTMPYPHLDKDPYMANLILSQRRALSVMYYIRSLPEYKNYSSEQQRQLEQWFTATGMSYSRPLYSKFMGREKINSEASKRVEIRIITSGEEILENFVEKIK